MTIFSHSKSRRALDDRKKISRNHMTALICVATLVSYAGPAKAIPQPGGQDITITKVILEYDGIYIDSPNIQNPEGCQIAGRAVIPNDSATAERYLSIAETALAANLKVDIFIDGCRQGPWGTMPLVYSISMHH